MTRLSSDPKMTNVLLPFVKESSENLKKKITIPASHHHHAYLFHNQERLGRLSLSEGMIKCVCNKILNARMGNCMKSGTCM